MLYKLGISIMNILIILLIVLVSIFAIFQIRRETIKPEIKTVLISFVIVSAIAVSATLIWNKKPPQYPSPNVGLDKAVNEARHQPIPETSQMNKMPSSSVSPQVTQASVSPHESGDGNATQSQAEVVKKVLPSVVMVKTPTGSGSGFFLDRNGSIVTNHHVLCGTTTANIITSAGQQYQITKILAEDREADLLVAQTDAPESSSNPLRLNPSVHEIGENIIAIGSPATGPNVFMNTVTTGIVSGIRTIGSVKWIQISAPTSKGNSGGPVINRKGEVIGVVSWGIHPAMAQNLNFCVSSEHITRLKFGSGFPLAQLSPCLEQKRQRRSRDVYCWYDSTNDKVNFVDFPTDTKISRDDGSLDRIKYEQWVFEKIGGNPAFINPAQEAQRYVDKNIEEIWRRSFPYKSISERSLTLQEQQFWHNNLNRIYVDIYNRAVSRKNEAIGRYQAMMHAFEIFSRQ